MIGRSSRHHRPSSRSGPDQSPRFVMCFTSLAQYRAPTMQVVASELGDELSIYTGTSAYEPGIRLIDAKSIHATSIRNHFGRGGLLFQSLPWRTLLTCRVLLMDLNPRVVHAWPVLLIRKALGRPTLLWGHAWPRAGRESASERLRGLMRGLASHLVSYTYTQAEELRDAHPGKPVTAAPNALYRADRFVFDHSPAPRHRLLYVGRLVSSKKPDLLVPAFESVAEAFPDLVLTIVGDGPVLDEIRARAAASPHRDRIEILGHISDYDALRTLYASAVVSLSPGYLGLSAVQSFTFGVPMIISRDEPHAPEIEAATVGRNCRYFETGRPQSLSDAIVDMVSSRQQWSAAGPRIVQDCKELYSVEQMSLGLVTAMREAGS